MGILRRPKKVPAATMDDVTLGLKQAADALRERFPAPERSRSQAEVEAEWAGQHPDGSVARFHLRAAKNAIATADWSKPPR